MMMMNNDTHNSDNIDVPCCTMSVAPTDHVKLACLKSMATTTRWPWPYYDDDDDLSLRVVGP